MRCCTFLLLFFATFESIAQAQVDPYTGAASSNVHMWTITSGDIGVPLSLDYYSSGMKLCGSEGSAGIGWSFTAGGSVLREVRGLPDDYVGSSSENSGDARNGWLVQSVRQQVSDFTPAANTNYADNPCTDETADYNMINGLVRLKDSEPDLFHFNAPGLSGTLVFETVRSFDQSDDTRYIETITTNTYGTPNPLLKQIATTNSDGTVNYVTYKLYTVVVELVRLTPFRGAIPKSDMSE